MPANENPPMALYVHWPFCKSKCPYCDFNSHVRDRIDEQAFRQAYLRELETLAVRVPGRRLTSIFFGGGTPSLMSAETVAAVIEKAHILFPSANEVEITLEANPTSVEAAKFQAFRQAGVNRVSLGVQSMRDASLKFLGREHSAKEALKAVGLVADIFPRFSFDLIYALPHQTIETWKEELGDALQYAKDHLSLYQLTIEENTAFHHAYHEKKAFRLPVDDDAARLYEITQETMEARGLPAYEISNHAKPGYESRHNLSYWLGEEYVGIGPGAHGRLCSTRSFPPLAGGYRGETSSIDFPSRPPVNGGDNVMWHATACIKSPERWLAMVQQQGNGLEVDHPLSARERLEERLMMRLRLTQPISLQELPVPVEHSIVQMLLREDLVSIDAEQFAITRRGRLVQQAIVGELIGALETTYSSSPLV